MKKLMISSLVVMILCTVVLVPTCLANAAEPPAIVIIVPNAPDDLEIGFTNSDTYIMAKKDKGIYESQFIYREDIEGTNYLRVTSSAGTYEIALEKPLKTYNNLYTLDFKNRTLTPGKSIIRSIILVSLRVVLTLLIEGAIFFLFGYRKKSSWILFLIANLCTQGLLNLWLNSFMPTNSYALFGLLFGEIMVLIAETILFLTLIKEHKRLRAFLYVFVANLISFAAGGYIITILPI